MTLIMALIDRNHVLQVGDRLTSRQYRGLVSGTTFRKPHEELSNKAAIYVATDAVVVASYTGVSYIKGKNTDTWIAKALAPVTVHDDQYSFSIDSSEQSVALDVAVRRLAQRLQEDFSTMAANKRDGGLAIQVVGWQWQQRPPNSERPIRWLISIGDESGATTSIDRLPRHWGWENNQYHFEAMGDRRSNPKDMMKRWLDQRNNEGQPFTIDDVEGAMVDTIRTASDKSGGSIGRNCISVLLRLSDANARVRYFPDSVKPLYPVFTPWIIAPGAGSMAPTVFLGGLPTVNLHGLEVIFERIGPATDPPGYGAMRSWPRRPEPR